MTMKDLIVNKEMGTVKFAPTMGEPCILHQNGRKVENRILEEVARELGMIFDMGAIEKAKTFK